MDIYEEELWEYEKAMKAWAVANPDEPKESVNDQPV
jgi:hypothetical protein